MNFGERERERIGPQVTECETKKARERKRENDSGGILRRLWYLIVNYVNEHECNRISTSKSERIFEHSIF